MKTLGYLLIIAGLLAGAGAFANYISKINRAECARKCPRQADAIDVLFNQPPVEFVLCRCKGRLERRGVDAPTGGY